MNAFVTARNYAHTLRHAKPWQVGGRLVARAKQRLNWTRPPSVPAGLRGALVPQVPFPAHDPWNERRDLLKGRFCFLNEREDLGWPVDWGGAGRPLLWTFNLHYFHYLYLLHPEERVALCRSWVHANAPGHPVSWHSYPTSLRIVNWCRAGLEALDLLESLYLQAAHLYRNLETYVYGNHLIENARALVLAGRFFDGQGEAPRWLEKGLALYRQETPEQVLADGGHFERSPMYHALVLEGYLDVLNVLPPRHPEAAWLRQTAARMADVLVSLTHPDGELVLFNDATQEIASPVADLVAYARALTGQDPQPFCDMPASGYFVHRDTELYLAIDGGQAGPHYLMAHAHADFFSFEMSVRGRQMVVDSGVYEYAKGEMRDYVRSTAAHNTVRVDGRDQMECWDSFLVARRAVPRDVRFARDESGSRFEGTFDGYARLLGHDLTHRRRLSVDAARRRVEVIDEVEGRGRHRVESRLHLHPEVVVEAKGTTVVLRRGDIACRLDHAAGELRWEDGWYCPAFGVRKRNRVAVLTHEGPLPARLAYSLHYG